MLLQNLLSSLSHGRVAEHVPHSYDDTAHQATRERACSKTPRGGCQQVTATGAGEGHIFYLVLILSNALREQ